jgi:CRP-like cAMP-binding protein
VTTIGTALLAAESPRNLILAGIPASQMVILAPDLEFMYLPQGTVLVKPETRLEYIYFLERGLASTDAVTQSGRSVEVGVTGREGVVGFHALLGQPTISHATMMQAAGSGYRIRESAFRRELDKGGELLRLFHAFLYSHFVQTSQSVLCNRLHDVEHRLARWLLLASDHTESDHLVLTQEYISRMLGSTRSTVTITAGELQERGLINYSRGKIQILKRPALEQVACECYAIVRDQNRMAQPKPRLILANRNNIGPPTSRTSLTSHV